MVASHYYIGCWQLEVTALFALLWYFDKIHTLSSQPNYTELKCQRFTYIDVLEVPSCYVETYYMLLIRISIPRESGTHDMSCSNAIWKDFCSEFQSEQRGPSSEWPIWFSDMRYILLIVIPIFFLKMFKFKFWHLVRSFTGINRLE